jgi:hypothetical protein
MERTTLVSEQPITPVIPEATTPPIVPEFDPIVEDYRSGVCLDLPPSLIVFPEEALHGLPGAIVRKLRPETESHPAAALIEILVQFGSLIGRSAYYEVEDTRHHTNLFAVKVGRSSKARKGTAGARIIKIFSQVDNAWNSWCVSSGLTSGEGLIYRVRDDVMNADGDKVIHPGVQDKRLLVRESEFARVLAVNKRDSNTLSPIMRDAWDGKETLRNMTRGRNDDDPLEATWAHISIIGDVTSEELNMILSASDTYNGFANRFLWVHVERTAIKPHGGKDLDWDAEIKNLKGARDFARKKKRIFMDENARKMWERVYPRLSQGHEGRLGAVTSRAEAQTMRVALIYALMDQSDHIRSEHLRAAVAFWRYCEESARQIFGGLTKTQHLIVEALKTGPMTASEFREKTFKRNRSNDDIVADLADLIMRRTVKKSGDKYQLA